MTGLRRVAGVLFAVLFVPVLMVVIPVTAVRGVIASPDFLIEQLWDADPYALIHDSLVPLALEEMLGDTAGTLATGAAPLADDVVVVLRAAFPPDYLQEETETALRTIWPWFTNAEDSFLVEIDLRPRARVALTAFADRVREDGDALNEFFVANAVNGVDEALADLPFGLSVPPAETERYVREVFPPEWLSAQFSDALTEVTPYALGDADSFAVEVSLEDRAAALDDVMTALLLRASSDNGLGADIVTSAVLDQIGANGTRLAPGIVIQTELIAESVDAVLSTGAGLEQDVARAVTAYTLGTSDTLAIQVDVQPHKEPALQAAAERIERDLEAEWDVRQPCTLQEIAGGLAALVTDATLPDCRPPGFTYDSFVQTVGLDVETLLRPVFTALVPDRIAISDARVRDLLGADAVERINDVRGWMTDGFTYTDEDLLAQLGDDGREAVMDIRAAVRDVITIDQEDIADWIDEDTESVDDFRFSVALWLRLALLTWMPAVALLLLATFVAGRDWIGRLTWASVVLFVGGAASWLVMGPVLGWLFEILLGNGNGGVGAGENLTSVAQEITDWAIQFLRAAAESLRQRMSNLALMFIVAGGIGFVASRILAARSSRGHA